MNEREGQRRVDHGMSQSDIDAYQHRYGKGPHLTVDLVVMTVRRTHEGLRPWILLIERGSAPFAGCHALPGGFVDMDEGLEAAARRELGEETGLEQLGEAFIEQLGTFGDPQRDPRGRVVSVVHLALVPFHALGAPRPGDDAAAAALRRWEDGVPVDDSGEPVLLAFDHAEVLRLAWERVQHLARFSSAPLMLLAEPFDLDEAVAMTQVLSGGADRPEAVLQRIGNSGWIEGDVGGTGYRRRHGGRLEWATP